MNYWRYKRRQNGKGRLSFKKLRRLQKKHSKEKRFQNLPLTDEEVTFIREQEVEKIQDKISSSGWREWMYESLEFDMYMKWYPFEPKYFKINNIKRLRGLTKTKSSRTPNPRQPFIR